VGVSRAAFRTAELKGKNIGQKNGILNLKKSCGQQILNWQNEYKENPYRNLILSS
jgi:hypothetical protein